MILNKSITTQFSAFKKGFDFTCGDTCIGLFRPEELQELICGTQELDFNALKEVTLYDNGYTKDSPIIQ